MRVFHAQAPGLRVITRADVLIPATREENSGSFDDHCRSRLRRRAADRTTIRKECFVLADI